MMSSPKPEKKTSYMIRSRKANLGDGKLLGDGLVHKRHLIEEIEVNDVSLKKKQSVEEVLTKTAN